MKEGVGAERVFVAVAHVALQAGSCKQTMLSGFFLGCKCEVAVSFLADPFNRKFHIVWLIYRFYIDSYIYVFDFFGPIGLKLTSEGHSSSNVYGTTAGQFPRHVLWVRFLASGVHWLLCRTLQCQNYFICCMHWFVKDEKFIWLQLFEDRSRSRSK